MFIENIFFDLDGVLIDACDWHYESLNKALEKIIGIKISQKEHCEKYNGLPSRIKLKILNIEEKFHSEILSLKKEYTNRIIEKECKIDEIKIEFLKYLKSNNIKTACVTNSITQATHLMLKKMGIYEYFDLILCNEDVSENKPSPVPYNTALKILNSNCYKTLIIEDSDNGFLSAIKSDVKLLWKVDSAKDVNLLNFTNIFGAHNETSYTNGRRWDKI